MEKSTSVHTFVEASFDAYGAVSYLRCEYDQGYYCASLIASKTNVAPLKAHDNTATGVDGSNSGFEPNLIVHRIPEHSNSRRTFLVGQYACFKTRQDDLFNSAQFFKTYRLIYMAT